jgi:hypothetical protein
VKDARVGASPAVVTRSEQLPVPLLRQDYYNHERPHGSLGNQTPWEKWWDLTDKTPLHEEVEAMYDPTKE